MVKRTLKDEFQKKIDALRGKVHDVILDKAIELFNSLSEKNYIKLLGKKPDTVVAGYLYVASIAIGSRITQQTASQLCGVTPASLRNIKPLIMKIHLPDIAIKTPVIYKKLRGESYPVLLDNGLAHVHCPLENAPVTLRVRCASCPHNVRFYRVKKTLPNQSIIHLVEGVFCSKMRDLLASRDA